MTGRRSVPLASPGRLTMPRGRPERRGKTLSLPTGESGLDLAVDDGAKLQPHLVAAAQVHIAGKAIRLLRGPPSLALSILQTPRIERMTKVVWSRSAESSRAPDLDSNRRA